jgi:hypothetical protein
MIADKSSPTDSDDLRFEDMSTAEPSVDAERRIRRRVVVRILTAIQRVTEYSAWMMPYRTMSTPGSPSRRSLRR